MIIISNILKGFTVKGPGGLHVDMENGWALYNQTVWAEAYPLQ